MLSYKKSAYIFLGGVADKHAAIARTEAEIADYALLKAELRELADSYTQRTAADQAGGRA